MKWVKRLFSMSLLLTFLIASIMPKWGMIGYSQSEETFKDIYGNFAEKDIQRFYSLGFIKGYNDGSFKPDKEITRAEFCKILNNFMGFTKKADIMYNDVLPASWFYDEISKAKAAGYIDLWAQNKEFYPNRPISRQEAFSAIAKVLKLNSTDQDLLNKFSDADKIQDTFKPLISPLIVYNFIKGYPDNTLRPDKDMTRAEIIKLLSSVGKTIITKQGEYEKVNTKGFVFINSKDVTLKDTQIDGNLYIDQSVGDGSVILNNTNVSGSLFVFGGGENSIKLINAKVKDVYILNQISRVRLYVEGQSEIEQVVSSSPSIIEANTQTNTIKYITVKQDQDIKIPLEITVKANIEGLFVYSDNVKANIDGSTVKNLIVSDLSDNFGLTIKNSKVEKLELNAKSAVELDKDSEINELVAQSLSKNTNIKGEGKIKTAQVYADQVVFNNKVIPKGSDIKIESMNTTNLNQPSTQRSTTISNTSDNSSNNNQPANNNGNNNNQTGGSNQTQMWELVWQDEFNSRTIDTNKWNFTIGAGGYGNNELQYYSDRSENARIEDGKLIIEARKENYQGSPYTSAKLTTQSKFSFTYGRVEVRAKLPEGQGLWPAIWMMPEDMNIYGGWPVCGEIDIMELLGQEPNKVYGTIHYGNPHTYHGGNYTLPDGKKFSDDFHVFALEWEPGEIRWYVDNVLYYKTNDWFSRSSNEAFDYTYPAPFDREFYLILNVAVGGNWPGNPPDNANYFPQRMEVDYVKVYKLVGRPYREAIKPAGDMSYPSDARPPLQDGNLIYNGSFDIDDPNVDGITGIPNTDYWQFLHLDQFGGDGTVENANNSIKINITNGGSQTYSVQLIQGPICLIKGKTYKLSFDAKSDGQRTIEVKLSSGGGDDGNTWIDYAVNSFTLDTDWKNYSYVFTMQSDTYSKARLEFNVGFSTLPVYIDNVRLEEYNLEDTNAIKEPLANGNLIYNGTFDQGDNRFIAWEFVKSDVATATYMVGSSPQDRYFKTIITNGGENLSGIKLVQSNLKINSNSNYLLSFKAKAFDTSRQIKIYISDQNYIPISDEKFLTLSGEWADYKFNLKTVQNFVAGCRPKLVFELGGSNVNVGIDNVSLKEVSSSSFMLIQAEEAQNYTNAQSNGQYLSFAQNGSAVFNVNIPQSGDYMISYKLKAQENCSLKLDVADTIYDAQIYPTNGNWVIVTDNVYLPTGQQNVSIAANSIDLDYIEIAPNFIQNGDFSNGLDRWSYWIGEGGQGSVVTEKGQLKGYITNIGTQFYHIQIIYQPMKLESGKTYRISFDAKSSEQRDMFIKIDDSTYYGHFERYLPLTQTMKNYTFDFEMDSTRTDARFVIGLGYMPSGNNPANMNHIVTIDNVRIAEVSENCGYFEHNVAEEISGDQTGSSEPVQNVGDRLLPEGQFDDNSALNSWNWWSSVKDSGNNNVNMSVENGELKVNVASLGSATWDPQIYREGIPLVYGKNYKISIKARASVDRKINVAIGKPLNTDPWFVEYMPKKTFQLTTQTTEYAVYFAMNNPTDTNAKLSIEIGSIDGYSTVPFDVYFDEIQIEVVDSIPPEPHTQKVGDELIPDGSFDNGVGEWVYWSGDQYSGYSNMQVGIENGKMKITLNSVGGVSYSAQVARKNLTVEKGLTYELSFKMRSTQNRTIQVNIGKELTSDPYFIAYAPTTKFNITTDEQSFSMTFKVTNDTDVIKVVFELGPIDKVAPPLPCDIYLDDVSLKVISDQ